MRWSQRSYAFTGRSSRISDCLLTYPSGRISDLGFVQAHRGEVGLGIKIDSQHGTVKDDRSRIRPSSRRSVSASGPGP